MVQYALFQDEHGWSEHQILLHCLRKSKNKNILLHLSSQSMFFLLQVAHKKLWTKWFLPKATKLKN